VSVLQWWAQRGEFEAVMREEYDRRLPECWQVEYEEWLDGQDEEPMDQFNRSTNEQG